MIIFLVLIVQTFDDGVTSVHLESWVGGVKNPPPCLLAAREGASPNIF